ncbi:MAG: NAD(+) synthase [Actinomycetota bacterium]|nr:NAD(+) synthase [Actinomycetota bacterium]
MSASDGSGRPLPFRSLYAHGFVRVAAASPRVRVGDPAHNAERTIELAREADGRHAALVVFPELGLSAYSNQDLFHQQALLDATADALEAVREASADLRPLLLVGAPLRSRGRLYNCAVALHRGRVLGVVPKSYLPNYLEFYEKRHFSAARAATEREVRVGAEDVPFGADVVFEATDVDGFVVAAEICEDLWAPVPPTTHAALAGATVLANLSASDITIGKAGYRHQLCAGHSARCVAAYVYTSAGAGESTTDLAWDGHGLVHENGTLLAESERFGRSAHLLTGDVDLERLAADRLRLTSFSDAIADHAALVERFRRVPFTLGVPDGEVRLERDIARFPYVPSDPSELDERCQEVFDIQVSGLATRLAATGIDKVVIGVSGGLDSTHALLVAVRCMDELGLARTNVLGFSLPGFATSERTRNDARRLMESLGVAAEEIDIRPAAAQMLRDLGHPAADGGEVYDIAYENTQAGARTSLLFRLANQRGALVLGTGDLSELALGWSTYGVGDQMSHYGVNGSVPKTLIQHLIRWSAERGGLGEDTSAALRSVLETDISPELVPGREGDDAAPHQRSEDVVGPYELQDFHLYYTLRFGYRPSKVAFLAEHAWSDPTTGSWPELIGEEDRNHYDLAAIVGWLRVFVRRFFQTSQFKRSALPDGPKVGSGGSLSPRGDWRAPSDASAAAWLAELDTIDAG